MLWGRGLRHWLLVMVAVGVLLEHSSCGDLVYSNSWAVEIGGGDAEADSIARKHGFTNLGRVSLGVVRLQCGGSILELYLEFGIVD